MQSGGLHAGRRFDADVFVGCRIGNTARVTDAPSSATPRARYRARKTVRRPTRGVTIRRSRAPGSLRGTGGCRPATPGPVARPATVAIHCPRPSRALRQEGVSDRAGPLARGRERRGEAEDRRRAAVRREPVRRLRPRGPAADKRVLGRRADRQASPAESARGSGDIRANARRLPDRRLDRRDCR